ncbi:MAG TPA: O-antigen ligase family protein [Roseomonas sp.]
MSRAASPPLAQRPIEVRASEFDDGPGLGALKRGPPRAWWWAASLPLSIAAVSAPPAAVLQSKAMAPIAIIAMLLAVLAHRRERGRWPWPRVAALPFLLALAAWGGVSALWVPDLRWALGAAGTLAGLALLAGACAVVVEDEGLAERRILAWSVLTGLVLGLALALIDHATGQWVRAAVRGLPETRPGLEFGLKPAASVMALLLPLVLKVRLAAPLRWLLMAAGAGAILLLPGDTAKLAALAGLLAAGLVTLLGRTVSSLMALLLAGGLLASPFLMPLALRPDLAAHAPLSSLHRMLIWDFAMERARERPVLGWGMEASRNLPGGRDNPSIESMARLGVVPEGERAWLLKPGVERLSLHPHNGALQIWLELGWVGLALAALAVLAMGWGAAPVVAGVLASAAVTFLASFGIWQAWWLATQALAAALAAGLGARRG